MVKNNFGSLALALAAASALVGWGCNTGSGDAAGTGGKAGTAGAAGAAGGGAGGSCSNGTACGGDLVGSWTVASSCLTVMGNLDLSLFGAGCPYAPVTGELTVTGTFTANADGTTSDATLTSGTEKITLASSCLVISSTPVTCAGAAGLLTSLGYSSLTCTNAAGGGCNCTGQVNQPGSIGLLSPAPSTSGNVSSSGGTATMSGDSGDARYSYCRSGGTLTFTPQSSSPMVTGTITLSQG